jgi:hypothetical protein
MNCEECKEQVFDLIEREAVEPDVVRRILERCPDCRAAFEETKAALALAAQLPIEEPTAAVDAVILRAASSRAARFPALRKRFVQPLPWAVAAIALLAIGVGVLAIPPGVQRDSGLATREMREAADSIVTEQGDDEKPALKDEVVRARPEPEATAVSPRAEREAAETRIEASSAAPAKRRAKSASDEPKDESIGGAPASSVAAQEAAGVVAEAGPSDMDLAAPAADEQVLDGRATASCRRKVAALKRRKRDRDDHRIEPEEELAIGKCYQVLGDVAEARKWLRRAAGHRETRARAEEVLRGLAPE